jgi:hypothetical protein
MSKKMNHMRILRLQKQYGFTKIQNSINSGTVWQMEGSQGREAMALLDSGACMLPLVKRYDAYNNTVPSRDVLKKGTKGTYQNSKNFWTGVQDGRIEIDEFAELD